MIATSHKVAWDLSSPQLLDERFLHAAFESARRDDDVHGAGHVAGLREDRSRIDAEDRPATNSRGDFRRDFPGTNGSRSLPAACVRDPVPHHGADADRPGYSNYAGRCGLPADGRTRDRLAEPLPPGQERAAGELMRCCVALRGWLSGG